MREPQALEAVEAGIKIDSSRPEFDDHLDKESARKKTWEVLDQLPEKYRCALIWRYWNGCPLKMMAMRSGRTEKAMERILARARDEFRWAWDQQKGDSCVPEIRKSRTTLALCVDEGNPGRSIRVAVTRLRPIHRVKKIPGKISRAAEFFAGDFLRGGDFRRADRKTIRGLGRKSGEEAGAFAPGPITMEVQKSCFLASL